MDRQMGRARYPKLVGWVEETIEETLTFYKLPASTISISRARMRWTSGFCAGVLFLGRASDLMAKRGVSAASAARRPTRSLPD